MSVPMQSAYEKEAKGVVSLKKLTLYQCEEFTYDDGPAN